MDDDTELEFFVGTLLQRVWNHDTNVSEASKQIFEWFKNPDGKNGCKAKA